jgi:tetratricopeptide (TPR) repeat protein
MTARIGMALIVRDAATTIEACLASFARHVDHVAILDTGSTDDTPQLAAVLLEQIDGLDYTLKRGDWPGDFAEARRQAEQLLPPDLDWIGWADADDEIHGAEHLRQLADQAPPDISALVFDYDYAQDENGQCVCRLKRERLVRRGHGHWDGRVHEAQTIQGLVQQVPAGLVEWRHRKPLDQAGASNTRNLRILRAWVKAEPANPRVLMYLGTELMARGQWKPAIRYLRRYLQQVTTWDEERAQVHRKLAVCLANTGDPRGAVRVALDALAVLPSWPDSALTLAEAHYELREPAKAVHWAQVVLAGGTPDTLLIINPLDYLVQPHVVLAGAHAALGDTDRAIHHAEQVLAVQPGHPAIRNAYEGWRAGRKREQTASTFLACAEMLVQHDEQLKALDVLRSVPYYAIDHPRVVALRSALRERIDPLMDAAGYAERYRTGGTKPEDMTRSATSTSWRSATASPGCAFLLMGLEEQAAAA